MPKAIDLTGQTFGKLTVLRQDGKKPNGEYVWLCQCECGNQISVRGYLLRKGKTTSCGCIRSEKHKDLIGKRINYITVLEQTNERDSSGCIMWLCQCNCGKKIKVPTTKLTSKTIQSCGCKRIENIIKQNQLRKIDLSGQRFNYLTILHESKQRSNDGQVMWICQCDCGNKITVRGRDLRTGNTKSCGCKRYISHGEENIKNLLIENNIKYKQEKSFSSCKFEDTNQLARFDFYLPNYNTIIEYDGKQHFIEGTGKFDNSKKFTKTQLHDSIKTAWCHSNNITIIRIPYTHLKNISLNDLLPSTSTFIV